MLNLCQIGSQHHGRCRVHRRRSHLDRRCAQGRVSQGLAARIRNSYEHSQLDLKPFPFLKLPGELRNRIYELLLTDTRGPKNFADPVILTNDLRRRITRRTASAFGLPPMSTGLSKKSFQLAKKFYMLNHLEMTRERLRKPVSELPLLLETAILRACRQTYSEGSALLFQKNTFAIIVRTMDRNDDLASWFPAGLDLSRVRRLRLEYQLEHIHGKTQGYSADLYGSTTPWAFIRRMTSLKTLQLVLTFSDEVEAPAKKEHFERLWHTMRLYRQLMQELIAAIPKGVEVKMGMTKEDKMRDDYGGFCPVRGSVLRKIYKTYGGIQGADVEMMSTGKVDLTCLAVYPIDGDGNDSDEEADSV